MIVRLSFEHTHAKKVASKKEGLKEAIVCHSFSRDVVPQLLCPILLDQALPLIHCRLLTGARHAHAVQNAAAEGVYASLRADYSKSERKDETMLEKKIIEKLNRDITTRSYI